MTHDEFLKTLDEVTNWADSSNGISLLPPGAAAHARECPECARVLAALSTMARDAGPGDENVPDGYWAAFDSRLAARTRMLGDGSSAGPRRPQYWRLAAAILVAAIVIVAWRGRSGENWRGRGGDGSPDNIASGGAPSPSPADVIATTAPENVESALAAFSVAGIDDEELPLPLADELTSADEAFASMDDLGDPLESVEAELVDSLSPAERDELTRKLLEAAS